MTSRVSPGASEPPEVGSRFRSWPDVFSVAGFSPRQVKWTCRPALPTLLHDQTGIVHSPFFGEDVCSAAFRETTALTRRCRVPGAAGGPRLPGVQPSSAVSWWSFLCASVRPSVTWESGGGSSRRLLGGNRHKALRVVPDR